MEYAKENRIGMAWLWRVGMGLILASIGSIIIVYFRPSAGGSGIPELIAFLNGTSIRHIYNVRTLLAKFVSCAFAVSSGLDYFTFMFVQHFSGKHCRPIQHDCPRANIPHAWSNTVCT